MRNLQLLTLAVLCLSVSFGCNSGDTPVETVQVPAKAADPNSYKGAIQGNPNMPDAAKKSLLGKGK